MDNKISNIKDRVLQFAKYKGIAYEKFCEEINMTYGSFKGIAKKRPLNSEAIEIIITKYNEINAEWLLTGKGGMLKSSDSQIQESQKDSMQIRNEPQVSVYNLKSDFLGIEKQSIPLYDVSAAAGLSTIFTNQAQQVPLDHIVLPNAPKCDGAMYIRGDSMYPLLKSGDIACYKAINSIDNVVFGEKYILDICNEYDDYLTVKYVQRSDKGNEYLKLVSENKHHSDRDILISTIRAIAIVKATIRFETLS